MSSTDRIAVYGPVRTVVWEGRSREAPPYPDSTIRGAIVRELAVRYSSGGLRMLLD